MEKKAKREISEARRLQLVENLKKAWTQLDRDHTGPALAAARVKNAQKAASARKARAVLRACPIGAGSGAVFKSGHRVLTVIDPVPVLSADGRWERKFSQSGSVTTYGRKIVFDGVIRVIWDYRPDPGNFLDLPLFEEISGSDSERESDHPGADGRHAPEKNLNFDHSGGL